MYNDDGDYVSGTRSRGGRVLTGEDEARAKGFINYNPAPGDVLRTCPYNTAHRVRVERLARHLTICRDAHVKKMNALGREPEFGICRYDMTHHVPRLELKGHENTCPGRVQVVSHIQVMQEMDEAIEYAKKLQGESDGKAQPISSFIGAVNTKIDGGTNVNDDDDSWETESRENIRRGFKAYDPQKKLQKESGKIIQSLQGISSKSERKAFYQHQNAMFEKRGGEFDDEGPSEKTKPDIAPSALSSVTDEDTHAKRAKDLMRIEKMNIVKGDHVAGRRRREGDAVLQIEKMIEKTRSESVGSSSFNDRDSDLRSETSESSSLSSRTVVSRDGYSRMRR